MLKLWTMMYSSLADMLKLPIMTMTYLSLLGMLNMTILTMTHSSHAESDSFDHETFLPF
jgi:hypothetical protein